MAVDDRLLKFPTLSELPMLSSVHEHRFNGDLLLHEEDRSLAMTKYPSIFHVLDFSELRSLFRKYDRPANAAKQRSLLAGVFAIACGFTALALAAIEIILSDQPSAIGARPPVLALEHAFAATSALFALLGFSIGTVGLLFAGRKREWLHNRLMGERIRQFYFQTLVARLPQVLASLADQDARRTFIFDRQIWLETFKSRLVGRLDAAFYAMIQDEDSHSLWTHDAELMRTDAEGAFEVAALAPLFDAYRELRILHQLGYADHKLHDDHRILSKMPQRQRVTLTSMNIAWIILLAALHAVVVIGAVIPHSLMNTFDTSSTAVAIIWVALAALSTRAIEAGLQPEREIERYQQYRSAVRAILDRYDAAASHSEKFAVMCDMERVSYDEMRNFLITSDRTRFVM